MTQPPPRPPTSLSASPSSTSLSCPTEPSSSTAPVLPKPPLIWRKRIPLTFSVLPYYSPTLFTSDGHLLTRYSSTSQPSSSPTSPTKVKALVDTGDRRPPRRRDEGKMGKDQAKIPSFTGEEGRGRGGEAEGWGGWTEEDSEVREGKPIKVKVSPPPKRTAPSPPPRPPSSPLLSPPLLALTLQYLLTSPLPQPCQSISRSFYLHLRLLTFRSSLLSSTHSHLSLRSLCLLAHLDLLEDMEGVGREGVGGEVTAPQLHRSLMTWAMMGLGVGETTAVLRVGDIAQWVRAMYDEVTERKGGGDEEKREGADNEGGQRWYRGMSEEEWAMMGEMAESALKQWKRATAEHSRRVSQSSTTAQPSPTGAPPALLLSPSSSPSSVVSPSSAAPVSPSPVSGRSPSALSYWSLPPLSRPSPSLDSSLSSQGHLRRYLSGSDIREHAKVDLFSGYREDREGQRGESPGSGVGRRQSLGTQRSSQAQVGVRRVEGGLRSASLSAVGASGKGGKVMGGEGTHRDFSLFSLQISPLLTGALNATAAPAQTTTAPGNSRRSPA